MLRQRTRTLQGVLALTDAAATLAAFLAGYFAAGPLLQAAGLKIVLPITHYLWIPAASVPMWWALFALFGGYDVSPIERTRDNLFRLAAPLVVGFLAIAAITFFQKRPDISRRVVAAISVVNIAFLLAGRALTLGLAARVHRKAGGLRRILIVGAGPAAQEFAETVRRAGWGLEPIGFIAIATPPADAASPCLGAVADLPRLLDERGVDDVVVAEGDDFAMTQQVLAACEEVGVSIHIPSQFFRARISRPHLERFFDIPMLTFSATPYNPIALGVKRAADLIVGVALLIVAAVPMTAIALIIKCTSRGPVFFVQERVGLYGRRFRMVKFRSMRADAESRLSDLLQRNEADGPTFKLREDPRVTRFGRLLRRFSLDELPQLWNVLRGDMSLIGPRPALPREVACYERWQRRRLSMRPGMTGIWQVSGRHRTTFEQTMQYDLDYIDHWSLARDLKIALRTIPTVLSGSGV